MNWVCDIETPQYQARDWNRRGRLEDFLPAMADWHFDWLDVPQFISSSDAVWNIRWSIRTRCRAGALAA